MQDTQTIKRRHTGGRPEKTAEDRRCIRVQPSFNIKEFEELEQRAARAGLETSEWLRNAGLGIAIKSVPEINRESYSALANCAANISKLTAQALNSGLVNSEDLTKLMTETREKVQLLRSELVGGLKYDW